jgi:uncharacterized protein (DUF2235 family)
VTKRIVLCFDGTWNVPDQKDGGVISPSNVFKMKSAVLPRDALGTEQTVFYDTGVGTAVFERLRGGIFGWGLSQKIKDGYRFIVDNFETGDEIYLFGFSRGAYTARSTAGMIRKCGVLRREFANKLQDAYELYRRRDADTPDTDDAQEFRDRFAQETRIRFIGVWDTVGELGIPVGIPWMPMTLVHFINKRWEFHDVKLSRSVDYAFQAVAIDERRPQFKPTLWTQNPTAVGQTMEQVWFAGVHTNVGGGYRDPGLSDITFLWMKDAAERAGLAFNADYIARTFHPDGLACLRDSRVGFYQLIPPFSRPIGRESQANESVHSTALERHDRAKDPVYKPRNLLAYLRRTGQLPSA